MKKLKSELFKDGALKTPYGILICMIITLLLEFIVFNYQSFLHIFNKESVYNYNQFNINVGSAIKDNGNGTYSLSTTDITTSAKDNNIYSDYEELQSNEIEITNIDKKIQTVCIEFDSYYTYGAKITTYVTDKSNKLYLKLPDVEMSKYVERSSYIQLHTNGETNKIKFAINNVDIPGNAYIIKSISFNKSVPFEFNNTRFIIVFLFLAFLFAIRPKSPLHKIRYDSTNSRHNIAVCMLLVATIGLFALMCFKNVQYGSNSPLNEYCDAIISGHLNIGDAPEILNQMENPYDANLRSQILGENNISITGDIAYYNGKFYVYYGILPVLLLYVPAKILFNAALTTNIAIFIMSIIITLFAFLLVKQINRLWFKNKMPIIIFMACIWFLTIGSGLAWSTARNEYYDIPVVSAYCCILIGLTMWLKSIEDKREKLKKPFLVLGSLFMALTALCRPTMLLVSFLAIPLFWGRMITKIFKKNKKSIINFIYFAIPYIVIGAITMILNYVRFDSVFSFGDKYQLTLTDMNSSSDIAKLPFGLFTYLIQPPAYSSMFPYILPPETATNYQGYYYKSDLVYGSVFLCYPITLCILAIGHMKEYLKQKDKSLYYFCLTTVIVGLATVAIATIFGGVHQRYAVDFINIFIIASILIFASICEKYKDTKVFKYLVIFMVIAMFIATLMLISQWAGGDVSLMIKVKQPKLYYSAYYAFNFFL